MENLAERNILRIPLAALQFAPDIRTRITQDEAAFRQHCLRLYSDYDLEVLERLRTQLRWAIQNPDYNFQGVLMDVKTANPGYSSLFRFSAECA
jgi:hypothetical protein